MDPSELRKRFPLLTALLLSLGPIHVGPPAAAQTSFGKAEATAPRNRQEWSAHLDKEVRRALRRSDTALNTVAHNVDSPQALAITIARDGSVRSVLIDRSSGRGKAMEAAYVRAFSTMKLPLFTPDMPGESVSVMLNLHTGRG